ncbi:MAG: hypothetical protein JO034_02705 [Singulisphaera sp.]|nr:hypothetical protein [Singulisphaera sp.]
MLGTLGGRNGGSNAVGRPCHAPSGRHRPPELGPRPRAKAARAAVPDRRALDPTRSGPARAATTPGPTAKATPAARPGPLHPTRHATAAKAPRRPREPAPAPEGLRPPSPGAARVGAATAGGPRGPPLPAS